MSTLYKRNDSSYYWWAAVYKGRRVALSTKMTQKHLAKKVKDQWDLNLVLGNIDFLRLSNHSSFNAGDYIRQYFVFIETVKSEKSTLTAKGILTRFHNYIGSQNVNSLDEITVKVINGYLSSLKCAPKTKKNHLCEISLMLDQAIKEDVISSNPAKKATLPKIQRKDRHRLLKPIDLGIIFGGAGSWSLYYNFLHHTGLRAGDVALLTYGNIDFQKKAITSFIRKSRRIHEFPLADFLIKQLPKRRSKDQPLFPELYAKTERKLNDNLFKPRKYMQELLKAKERPNATLHSFRHTFNNTLRDLGLAIEDRQVLLAHASSDTNKIYTHPNFDLASQYVNKIPVYDKEKPN